MLKMEIIKFEAQDVITTSIPKVEPEIIPCECTYGCYFNLQTRTIEHGNCGCERPGNEGHTHAEEYWPEN